MENNSDGDENVPDAAEVVIEAEDANVSKETRRGCVQRMDSRCKVLCICITFVMSIVFAFACGVVIGLVMAPEESSHILITEIQRMANNTEQLQLENNQLMQLVNSTIQNFTLMERANGRLKLLINATQQTSMQLETENKQQRSVLSTDKLSFLWHFCDNDTLQCSRCLHGWVEHASRCFYISSETDNWPNARKKCLLLGADLAVVLNAEDQVFLTNMTFNFAQGTVKHFHSAWIGLNDLVRERKFVWINGNKLNESLVYWQPKEPNNFTPRWDKEKEGQDCVAIVPPKRIGEIGWLNSWDDIVCVGPRNYLCETKALNVS